MSTFLLPHLNPTSIKNKYYKMMHSGQLDQLLKTKDVNEDSKSDDRIIEILVTLAASC